MPHHICTAVIPVTESELLTFSYPLTHNHVIPLLLQWTGYLYRYSTLEITFAYVNRMYMIEFDLDSSFLIKMKLTYASYVVIA